MDSDFYNNEAGLKRAVDLIGSNLRSESVDVLPLELPSEGIGANAALERLAPVVLGGAMRLGGENAFAHMDPPTPWISWAMALWNASLNQNLLHPGTSPAARGIEQRVVEWLAPSFGMDGGHMTPGSSLANLTALWAARECVGIRTVFSSAAAHLSVAKAANILGLRHCRLPTLPDGAIDAASVDAISGQDLARSALVLTAGTTGTGAIDRLDLAGRAAWTHVDAAWGGPLVLSERYAQRLAGIERADSVAVSAHKWLFQPKDSALIFFRETSRAHTAISFGGDYLAVPNIGVQGSRGAAAVPLLATMLAWGKKGIAGRVEQCMEMAERWAGVISGEPRLRLLSRPKTGIVVWRTTDDDRLDWVQERLPQGTCSSTVIDGVRWLRNVSANPNADVELLIKHIARLLDA